MDVTYVDPVVLPGAPDPRHPIVAAALDSLGVDPASVLADERWARMQRWSHGKGVDGRPTVMLGRERLTVHRQGPTGYVVFHMYENMDEDAPTFWANELEIRGWEAPSLMLPEMVGRTVDEIVDLPGAEGIRILKAVNMANGLVLAVEHAAGG